MRQTVGAPLYGGTFQAGSSQPEQTLSFVLPGEVVDGSAAELTVLQPSSSRTTPRCVHFGLCGGCQYQHIAYPEQLLIKAEILTGLLAGLGAVLPPVEVHAAEPWGYRNRIRLRVASVEGKVRIGYSRRASNAMLPIGMCPIATPLLWHTAASVQGLAARSAVAAAWLEASAELELFCSPDETHVQAQLLLRDPPPRTLTPSSLARMAESLQAEVPQLRGFAAAMHPEAPRRARLAWSSLSWGVPGLGYPVAGRVYWVSRGAFFQNNRFLLDVLVELVTSAKHGRSPLSASPGVLAWDLFAGVGLFTRALAERFQQVVAVEGSPQAAADLARLARAQPEIQPRHEAALEFLRNAVTQRERPSLVVLDPPRAGLGVEGAALLTRIAPAEIVYVSCDPVTLARDLRVLFSAGYRAVSVDLVDLFPQTFHLETIVRLQPGSTAVV